MAYIATFILDDFYNHSELNPFSSVKHVSWGAVTFVLGWLVLGVAGLFDEDVNRFFFLLHVHVTPMCLVLRLVHLCPWGVFFS